MITSKELTLLNSCGIILKKQRDIRTRQDYSYYKKVAKCKGERGGGKMQKIIKGVFIVVCVLMMFALTACGNKYCSVSGCPKEHSRYSNYCYEHKCLNSSCNNKATSSYGYCSKCLNH